ncbi:MAG: hypothetical protein ABJH68_06665 [Ilumatobacter sp.]
MLENPRSRRLPADTTTVRLRSTLTALIGAASVGAMSVVVSAAIGNGDIDGAAVATRQAERVDAPQNLTPDRPRVFLAFSGSNALANVSALDPQWRYVRENLDGFWGNNAGIAGDEIARLVTKTDTRQLISESAFNGSSFFVETYDYVERIDQRVDFEREAITFYTSRPSGWDGDSIAGARRSVAGAAYGPGDDAYINVFTGWQPQNFYTDRVRQYPPIAPGSSAERAVYEGDGIFVECPHDVCNGAEYEDGFFRAMRIARDTGQRFVWLASRLPGQPRSGWLREFQTMYNRVTAEGLWRPGDIVVVISYNGEYPAVPETDSSGRAADTITGILYWALRQ